MGEGAVAFGRAQPAICRVSRGGGRSNSSERFCGRGREGGGGGKGAFFENIGWPLAEWDGIHIVERHRCYSGASRNRSGTFGDVIGWERMGRAEGGRGCMGKEGKTKRGSATGWK